MFRGPCRERVLCSSEGGPSKAAEVCSGGRAERVLGSGEGGPSKVAEGCSAGRAERERVLGSSGVARRRLLQVVPEAVQRE